MKHDLLFIETHDKLFRGFGRLWPVIAWLTESSSWVTYDTANPLPDPWGELITLREAERLYPGSTTASPPAGIAASADFDGPELIRYRPGAFRWL